MHGKLAWEVTPVQICEGMASVNKTYSLHFRQPVAIRLLYIAMTMKIRLISQPALVPRISNTLYAVYGFSVSLLSFRHQAFSLSSCHSTMKITGLILAINQRGNMTVPTMKDIVAVADIMFTMIYYLSHTQVAWIESSGCLERRKDTIWKMVCSNGISCICDL